MPQIAKLIGGPGTGKTAELLRVMASTVNTPLVGGDPMRIGFMSFTRAARYEAAKRASEQFHVPLHQLQGEGWFRTLHSVCKRCLGVGKALLTDDKESRAWIDNALQEPIGAAGREEDGYYTEFEQATNAARALQLWAAARNRLTSLKIVHEESDAVDSRTPDYPYCARIVNQYEQAKRLAHRLDFVDLLGRFAGYRFSVEGAEVCEPQGEVPDLPAWFFDEQQDVSALLHAVCQRLVSECTWAYFCGDPFQSIYGWAGASPKWFWQLHADKERIMPRSYRCPGPVLQLGERILRPCADYRDRQIEPAEHEGAVQRIAKLSDVPLDPRESWLILVRTNYLAQQVASQLDRSNLPWVSTHGGSHWRAPVRSAAISALRDIQQGAPIDGSQWQQILKFCPSRTNGDQLLIRGTKSHFEMLDDAAAAHPWVMPTSLGELGATEACVRLIREGRWQKWKGLEQSQDYLAAVEQWGEETVASPRIRLGTIHSAKGAEADNVVLLTTLSGPCRRSAETSLGADEERRVWYVGATRARYSLYVLDDVRARMRQEIPDDP